MTRNRLHKKWSAWQRNWGFVGNLGRDGVFVRDGFERSQIATTTTTVTVMEMNNDSDTSKYNYIHNDDIDGNHNDCQ